jgi:hypothetical protein
MTVPERVHGLDALRAFALRWATSFGTSLTMMVSVFGWMGCFVRFFNRPSARARYVADASHWIYVTHLPLVVALQVWWVHSGMPWWIQVPLVNVGNSSTSSPSRTGRASGGARRRVEP